MLAHAFLSVMTTTTTNEPGPPNHDNPRAEPITRIALTRNEIRRLFAAPIKVLQSLEHRLHWSHWRRRHQAIARASHYRRRAEQRE
jgi:hypothetical protein